MNSTTFDRIQKKFDGGERLSEDDALFLFRDADLIELGRLADECNQKLNGSSVFFNVNRHMNPTNVCQMSCRFCSFSRRKNEAGAFERSLSELIETAGQAANEGATELHITGGLHPEWPFDRYLDLLERIREKFPSLH